MKISNYASLNLKLLGDFKLRFAKFEITGEKATLTIPIKKNKILIFIITFL